MLAGPMAALAALAALAVLAGPVAALAVLAALAALAVFMADVCWLDPGCAGCTHACAGCGRLGCCRDSPENMMRMVFFFVSSAV